MRELDNPPDPDPPDYDAELQRYDRALRRATLLKVDDHVLDIGCGTGQTTRHAARACREGSALGVDISAAAVHRARELASAQGPDNVAFERADVQVHRFRPAAFDVAISRFGTMFFGDPSSAFANIGRALRPGGRLVMVVWQSRERNEWDVAIRGALEASDASPPPAGLDPFSLADPSNVTRILDAAGFVETTIADVREPVFYGPDLTAALQWVSGFAATAEALRVLPPAAATQSLERLRDMLSEHLRADGVWFDSRAWMVTARRA